MSTLQVTYLRGVPLVAYYRLASVTAPRTVRTEELAPGLVVDFGRGGKPLGVEIVDPGRASVAAMNRVLRKLKQRPVSRKEMRPLRLG